MSLMTLNVLAETKMLLTGAAVGARAIIKVSGHQYRWLAGGYNLEIGHFGSG